VAQGGESVSVLLDVCHNPHGASALAGEISRVFGKKAGLNCLISVLSDKDAAGIWTALKGNIVEAIPFRSSAPRSWQVLPVGMGDEKVGPLRENFAVAWIEALANTLWREGSPWLICGSVAAVGEVLKYWRDHGWVVTRVSSD
jgi:folylpolyglutamate synthase/dihydropteroate synthase